MWAQGGGFIIVEHDVVVEDGALDELEHCQHDWCSFQVPYVGRLYAGLSCAKFSAGLIARHPDALDQIAELEDEDHTPGHWCRLDEATYSRKF